MHYFTSHVSLHQTNKHLLTHLNISAVLLITLLMSCSQSPKNKPVSSALNDQQPTVNDVAMTVRSIVDALNIGEKLDSSTYNFNGVLTDGRGVPLYTNMEGYPGEWVVEVTSQNSAVIRNTELGDLYGDDLKDYLIKELNLSNDNLLYSDFGNDTTFCFYDIGKGLMQFEMISQQASNDMKGIQMNIYINSNLPN